MAKQAKSSQFTIFDWVKSIIDTKPSWDSFNQEQQKLFNGFMINKILSMNPKYIDIVNYVQGLNIQDNRKIYEVYCWFIPQSKNTYSPFIKSKNKETINDELLSKISQYFECSLNEAKEYISMLDKNIIKEILEKFGMDDKEIKKLNIK
jgi:hypothetical protein